MMLDAAGIDFMVIDMEHGSYSQETVADLISGCRGTRVAPFVRIPKIDRGCITAVLDAGACGILAANVETAEEVRHCVEYACYAPMGRRGVSLLKGHTAFHRPERVSYTQAANERVLVMVQVESDRAIQNIDAILEVDGLDLAFIGPADLAHSLSPNSEQGVDRLLEAAIRRVAAAAHRHGVHLGIHVLETGQVASLFDQGARLFTVASDASLIISRAQHLMEEVRPCANRAVITGEDSQVRR